MSKKSFDESKVKKCLKVLYKSCCEGYSGVWDSTGEGREGFMDMALVIDELADSLGVKFDRR